MPPKACSRCKVEKPLDDFHLKTGTPDGHRADCKVCRHAEYLAARQGVSPDHDMTRAVPDGFHVRGISTLYDGDGNIRAQWVKSGLDHDDHLRLLRDAVEVLAEPFRGLAEPIAAPDHLDADLLAAYVMGDPHVGMYAWALETGDDFDLRVAEDDLLTAVDQLVAVAPAAEQGLVVNTGDFYHADNSSNRTARSGNALDVDTRYAKVLATGVRVMRRIVDRALQRHARVRVINAIGNHDDHSSLMLSLCLAAYYEREPRVEVDTSPAKFHWVRHGDCLIGVTHGDTVKLTQLPGVMSVDRARDWGETEHRHWYTGHVHHDSLTEFPGVTVETARTLAPRDAYAAGAGYRAGQDLKCDTWHRLDGRVQRNIIGIRQVRRLQRERRR